MHDSGSASAPLAAPALFDEAASRRVRHRSTWRRTPSPQGPAAPGEVALEVLAAPGTVRERWTHGALREAVARCAGGLRGLGLGRGGRVLLRLGNDSSFPILFFAANAIGGVPVPTSVQLTDGEIAAIIADLEPRAIFVGEGLSLRHARGAVVHGPTAIAALGDAEPADFVETGPEDPISSTPPAPAAGPRGWSMPSARHGRGA